MSNDSRLKNANKNSLADRGVERFHPRPPKSQDPLIVGSMKVNKHQLVETGPFQTQGQFPSVTSEKVRYSPGSGPPSYPKSGFLFTPTGPLV